MSACRKVGVLMIAAALLPLLGGCGTYFNFSLGVPQHPLRLGGDPEIYGGLQIDAEGCGKAVRGDEGFWFSLLGFVFLIFDFPLSFIPDTLTLPITIPMVLTREEKKEPKRE